LVPFLDLFAFVLQILDRLRVHLQKLVVQALSLLLEVHKLRWVEQLEPLGGVFHLLSQGAVLPVVWFPVTQDVGERVKTLLEKMESEKDSQIFLCTVIDKSCVGCLLV
jgi:hypothetical protein